MGTADATPPALELANTYELSRGEVVDLLATPEAVRAWLAEASTEADGRAELLARLRAPAVVRVVHDEALHLRAAIRHLLAVHADGTAYPTWALDVVGRAVACSATEHRLDTSERVPVLHARERSADPRALLAPFARSAVELVRTADPARLRHCAAPGCPMWFLDTSKAGRRRWCSMARCGNRRKAARHRRRSRS